MIDSVNRKKAIIWFESIATKAKRLTTGNCSQEAASIRGLAMCSRIFILEHGHKKDKILTKMCTRFERIKKCCEEITPSNVLQKKEQIRQYVTWCKWLLSIHQFEDDSHSIL